MNDLILLGASTRAAATSARRAGWTPWCADLFADADLERIATVLKVPADQYPEGLVDALRNAPPGPVMYTGALENRPDLVARIDRPLLGNSAEVLRTVRSPRKWTACLQANDLLCPAIAEKPMSSGRWLLKPRKGAAGFGIHAYAGQTFDSRTHFLQERIDGLPCSAIFLGHDDSATLLGVTEQLIGTPWLNAAGFHYAGSIGPLPDVTSHWREIGAALAKTFHLGGPFGVDAVLRDGVPWPVEINPRYTASVEVIERACRKALLPSAVCGVAMTASAPPAKPQAARGILFARRTFAFPADGPWLDALKDDANLDEAEFADIPHAGEIIEQGRPVLTIFASANSVEECRVKLQEKAHALDRRLWG